MSHGGVKISGRYLKRGSVTLDRVKVSPFNFETIPDIPVIYSDNPGNNIIHADLHEEAELKGAVLTPKELFIELIDPNLKAPVVFPRNFTKDWLEDKKKQKKRGLAHFEEEDEAEGGSDGQSAMKIDDEEDGEYGQAPEATSEQTSPDSIEEEMRASATSDVAIPGPDPTIGADQKSKGGGLDIESLAQLQRAGRMTVDDSMNIVGKAIKDMASSDARVTTDPSRHPTNQGSDFIPVNLSQMTAGQGMEDAAIAEYARQKAIEEIDLEGLKEEARAQGFEAGFRVGEERATIQYREKVDSLFKNVQALVTELSGLKRDILEQVQGNFYEIAQAMCEALMERAIDLDPSVFSEVMARAVAEGVEGELIKVRVSPKMANLLSKMDLGSLAGSVSADNGLGDDEFRVDSKLGVVDTSIRKIIRDLLDQADMRIFDLTGKAV